MPGGSICSVAICKSNSKKAKEMGEHIMFFTFPKNPQLRKEWIKRCHRKDKLNPENKRICSKHFKEDDYEDQMQAKLMNTFPRKLKKNAIPSLHLLPAGMVLKETSDRVKRCQEKERKILVESLTRTPKLSENNAPVLLGECSQSAAVMNILDVETSSRGLDSDLRVKLEMLQKESEILKRKLLSEESNVEKMKHHITELVKQLEKSNINFEDKVKVAFKDFLTSNQVDIVLKKKSRARWTQEELSRAFTLRYFSKRSYIYLRETLHYPLPGISTLQQWAANINLKNGILNSILQVMETTGKVKNAVQRTTVLSFDEVKVMSTYEYDQKEDEVLGPHAYMQVVMARGLFDNWKEPVYIAFDKKMTKTVLENIISRLHKINYNVVACTSDCGSGNQGLWKELDINIKKTYTVHPDTQEPVYFFADVPHLLKLLRNWLIDTGFILENGVIINADPIKALIETSNAEISSCHKLTSMHIQCKRTQRQNVRLAAEVFSNTVATALKRYLPGNDVMLAKNVGAFVELVNNWFDILNSYTPSAKVPSKKPYGTDMQQQNVILNEMKTTVAGMRCRGKNTLQIFQKGIIISITSLQDLFKYLNNSLNVSFILTHRLNQDCLENLFSQLRTRGGLHDHPSPLNAIYRLRMILLGKNPGITQTNTNVESPPGLEDEEYLLAKALKQAKIQNIRVPEPQLNFEDIPDESSSTTSSTSGSSASGSAVQAEKDGLMYIAGYLAKKYLQKYPHLGQYTHGTDEAKNIHSYAVPSWIQSLSFGGLIQPSESWMQQVKLMEKYFKKLHQDTFNSRQKIINRTSLYIQSKVNTDIPQDLVKAFARQRIFVRIKYLNVKREETKLRKRKAAPSTSRNITKKMKKIVN